MAQDKLKTSKGVFLKESASTRAATCVAIAPLKGYERSEVEQTGDTLNKI